MDSPAHPAIFHDPAAVFERSVAPWRNVLGFLSSGWKGSVAASWPFYSLLAASSFPALAPASNLNQQSKQTKQLSI
jgi:hypothetical protein